MRAPRRPTLRFSLLAIVALLLSMLVAACGDDEEEPAAPATTAVATTEAAPAEATTAEASTAAAATTDPAPVEAEVTTEAVVASTAAEAAFPVTIPHAFGETTIEAAAERIVTWGWGSADAVVALGETPVAIPTQAYGGDADGVLPWIRQALEERGDDVPTILPDSSEEPPYEEIAAADPDLILAPYSGITEEQYELLTEIAPTVAYPGEAWSTPWRDVIATVGLALGKPAEATALLEDLDGQIAAKAAEHPELAGKTVAMVWDADGTFYVYKAADARVEFAEALGMVSAPSVEELGTDESTFYFTLSYENLDRLTSDVLVSFADTEQLSKAFLASSHGKTMAQVEAGAVAEVVGQEFVAAVSPPTALSLTWGLDHYVELLAGAAARADAAG